MALKFQNNLYIRQANLDDAEALHQIDQACFSLPWSINSFKAELEKKEAYYFLASSHLEDFKDRILGYIGVWEIFAEGEITNLAVLPEFRSQGVGHFLLQHLMGFAVEKSLASLSLELRESNETAYHLYQKFSFLKVGSRTEYYQKPKENSIILRKNIVLKD